MIFKRLFSYVLPYWPKIIAILACTAIVNALALAPPLLLRGMVDKALPQKNLFLMLLIAAAVPLIVGTKGVFSYAQGYWMNFLGLSCVKKIREEMFEKLQHLPVSFFQKWTTGEVFSRLVNDAAVLTEVLGTSVVYLANDALVLAGSFLWMLWLSPAMTLLTLTASPLIAFIVLRFGSWMNRVGALMQARIADLSQVLVEGVTGIHVVKSCGREDFEIQKFKNKNEEYFTWGMKSVQASFTQTPVVEFVAGLGVGLLVYLGGVLVVKGRMTVGEVFAFWTYMAIAVNPLYRLSSTLTNLQKAKAAAVRIFEVVDAEDEQDPSAETVSLAGVRGKIEFKEVWFRYGENEPWVLENVNLAVEPGTCVALIGPSGAGKSSLVDLIPKFYRPAYGAVYLDGIDTAFLSVSALRRHIGIVSQEILLFSGTVRDNILYGRPEASMEEVVEAAKAANAHDFICRLRQGYDSPVGERGSALSVGQRQRVAIARALLRNPRILILDEATSNLDAESEKLIQEALVRLLAGRTSFVIAHRLSTIRHADKIVAIEGGKIVETGSHRELLNRPGVYSRLYQAQTVLQGA